MPDGIPVDPFKHGSTRANEVGKKGRMSPPSPLNLVEVSLASPIDDESPILVRALAGNDTRGGTRKKAASWKLWGNDMSHLRLKTGGFVDRDMWVMRDGKIEALGGTEVGQGGTDELRDEKGERKWSLGEEWEVVEVE